MSKYKIQQKKTEKEHEKLDTESKLVLGGLGVAFLVLFIFVCGYGYKNIKASEQEVQIKNEQEKERAEELKSNQYKLADYTTLEAAPSAEDAPTQKIEGTIGFDAYYELSKKEIAENLLKYKNIIGDEVYDGMIAGMESDYFKTAIEYNYNDMINEMTELIEEAWVSSALYDKYKRDGEEMPEYEKCAEEDCQLLKYITNYTRGEVHDYLLEAHDKWEVCKLIEASKTSADESYMNLFYQEEICNNYDYLEDIELNVLLLNGSTASLGIDALQEAYDARMLEVKHLTWKDNKEDIKQFNLYKDIDYYDENLKDLAVDTIQMLFGSDLASNSYHIGSFDSVDSSNSDLVAAINDANEYNQGEDTFDIDYSKIAYWNTESLSLVNRNPDDVIYILWKIVPGSCKHIDAIPPKEEIYSELYEKAKMHIADSMIANAIYAELNDLDEEAVHTILRDNYGVAIPYNIGDDGEPIHIDEEDEGEPIHIDEEDEGEDDHSDSSDPSDHSDSSDADGRPHYHDENGNIVYIDDVSSESK